MQLHLSAFWDFLHSMILAITTGLLIFRICLLDENSLWFGWRGVGAQLEGDGSDPVSGEERAQGVGRYLRASVWGFG